MSDRVTDDTLVRMVCDRVHFVISEQLTLRDVPMCHLEAKVYVDHFLSRMIVSLVAEMPAVLQQRLVIDQQWPADWWQAWRARWLPKWWLRRWPVRCERISIDRPLYAAICPHLDASTDSPHLMWLLLAQQSLEGGSCS